MTNNNNNIYIHTYCGAGLRGYVQIHKYTLMNKLETQKLMRR